MVANDGLSNKGPNDKMQPFFNDVELVKNNIHAIKDATKRMQEINQAVVQATTSDKEQSSSSELEALIKSTTKKASIAKQILQRLREETENLLKANPKAKNSPEIRIRENLVNTLTRKFVDVMKDYQAANSAHKMELKKKVKRQIQIAKPNATEAEIEAVFQSGTGAGDVLKTTILKVCILSLFSLFFSHIMIENN